MDYNLTVTVDEDATDEELDAVSEVLDDPDFASASATVASEGMLASGPDKKDVHFTLVVPESFDDIR